jgi:quercetin dioxygenase-like cupin family protein
VDGARVIKAADVFRYSIDGFSSEFTQPKNPDELVMGTFSTGPGLKVPPHHHTCNTIAYLVNGRAAFEVGTDLSERLEMEPGDYVVINAGIVHTEETVGDEPAELFLARDHGGGDTIPVDPEDAFWK